MTNTLDAYLPQSDPGQFLPYSPKIYLNYTNNPNALPNNVFTALEDTTGMQLMYSFTGITRAGNASLLGSGIASTAAFNLTILPGPISATYSYVSNEQLKVTAGSNATIYVSTADMYGNPINLTNSTLDIQTFNNAS